MGRFQTKAAECEYKEYDRLLTEQFIKGLDDEGITSEILNEVSTLENIEYATSERVLLWAQREEVQRVQKVALNNIKEAKEFDSVRPNTPKHDNETHNKLKEVDNCKYCWTGYLPRQCPAYSK